MSKAVQIPIIKLIKQLGQLDELALIDYIITNIQGIRAWQELTNDDYLRIDLSKQYVLSDKTNPITVMDKSNIKPPSVGKIISNATNTLITTAKTLVSGEQILASEQTVDDRRRICLGCEFWNASNSQCNKCGCQTGAKILLQQEKCPVGKW